MENLKTFEEFGFWRKLVDPTGKIFGEEKPKPVKEPDDRPIYKKIIDPTGDLFGGKKPPVRQKSINVPEKIMSIPKIGDRLVYLNDDSAHCGKTGSFIRVREDGKWVVEWIDTSKDSVKKFAGRPENFKLIEKPINMDSIINSPNIGTKKDIDPFVEEDWGDEEIK